MCCQSQGTKGALFTSREAAQRLRGVRRVPRPAALPLRGFLLPCLSSLWEAVLRILQHLYHRTQPGGRRGDPGSL